MPFGVNEKPVRVAASDQSSVVSVVGGSVWIRSVTEVLAIELGLRFEESCKFRPYLRYLRSLSLLIKLLAQRPGSVQNLHQVLSKYRKRGLERDDVPSLRPTR